MSKTKKYYHVEVGFNLRMTNIQAAIGVAQLSSFKKFLHKRKSNYKKFYSKLKSLHNIKISKNRKMG